MNRDLSFSVAAAFLLHISLLILLGVKFTHEVTRLPFKTVNIRLGSGNQQPASEASAPSAPSNPPAPLVEKKMEEVTQQKPLPVLKKTIGAASPPAKKKPVATHDAEEEKASAAKISGAETSQNAKNVGAPETIGNPAGGNGVAASAPSEVIVARYEQVISLWLAKFQLYPEEARRNNIQGEAVVRLQIDRQGRVLRFGMEKKTGSDILDKAILVMMENLKTVPKAPENYPGGNILEFLIPVRFSLH